MVDAVAELLQKHKVPFVSSGRDYKVKCLNPEHDDGNPSLRIDKTSGQAHCFSCGWKANIFFHFNETGYMVPVKVAKLKQKLEELYISKEAKYPNDIYPYSGNHRGISPSTYKKFEAFVCESVDELQDRIIFPVKSITGELVSFVGRHTLSNVDPRYLIYPKNAATPPYPIILNKYKNYAVLVEGFYDMLNLVDKGMSNVVCCFGTASLRKNAKNKLLPIQAQGIKKIYIAFDGDDSGRKAAEDLKVVLEEANYITEVINLPDDEDPGSLTQEHVNYLIRYIDENSIN